MSNEPKNPTDNNQRFSLFPIKYQNLWKAYKSLQDLHWPAHDVQFTNDVNGIKELRPDELHFLQNILAFFNQSDGIINENLALNFYRDIVIPEARAYYTVQMAQETVHSEVYSLLLQEYVSDEAERLKLYNAIDNFESVRKKAEWAKQWLTSKAPLAERLLAFALIEGVFFSGSFCAIFWFRERTPNLTGLCTANDFISRDETLHCRFAIEMYKTLAEIKDAEGDEGLKHIIRPKAGPFNKVSQERIEEIVTSAVESEIEFLSIALPKDLIGMNKEKMAEYIKAVADYWLKEMGFKPIYNARDPFGFMAQMTLTKKVNQFEKFNPDYSRELTTKEIKLVEDF